MTDLQNKVLEMMKWLHKFIVDNGLRYYVFGGTMLGAARHKGFIPWDDDIDIIMPRDDYEKLCSLLKTPIDHYVIETPYSENKDYVYSFAKLYDINTTMTEHLRKDVTRGVAIDIFPIDGLGNTLEEAKRYYRKIDRKNAFKDARVCAYRKGRKWYKNFAIFLARLIPNCFVSEHKLCQKIDALNKKRSMNDYQFFGINMSKYRSRDIHNKDLLGKPTEFVFEDTVVYGFEHYEEYLRETFGDWKKLPPESSRHPDHDFINLDLNKSFMTLSINNKKD